MNKKQIEILNFKIDVYDFGYASYFYPSFNKNIEFKVSKKGYKQLANYLRTIRWIDQIDQKLRKEIWIMDCKNNDRNSLAG